MGGGRTQTALPYPRRMYRAGYSVTNVPGQGMGEFGFAKVCGVYAFSINSVDANELAHGFQFSLISSKGCQKSPNVIGGTAYLQP